MDESSRDGSDREGEGVSRRVVGWVLLLCAPGVFAGISLTAFFLLPREFAHPFSLAGWAVAAAGTGVGGYLAPRRDRVRPGVAVFGVVLGLAVYWFALAVTGQVTGRF